MVSPDEARVCLWLPVSCVGHCGRQSTIATCPVVERNEIKVIVESALGLFLDDAEYLANGSLPCCTTMSRGFNERY